ncbi:hypothetical protein T440DRAFT_508519 [Plenodomus tracheiphilus IPT5]|uniref:Uncharacterized protein n=1 Tax=Plenodomus tracheiphilus IPT5 TaxID=1408161 RepID=A0A6A7B5U6_9PLEO|nr:hypothetical protein T440DRAFT_508519 [Plenodomus tracheiphilus IPT5]
MIMMDFDETMLSLSSDVRIENAYFYTVISSHSKITYHPSSSSSPYLLHPPLAFSPHHLSKDIIETHFQPFSAQQTPFTTIFDNFAQALNHTYEHHTNGATFIQILRLNIPDLIPTTTPNGIPILYSPSTTTTLLHVPTLAPVLGVNPIYTHASEYLSCGPMPRSAFSAAWPIIRSSLYFEQDYAEYLVDLMIEVCGRVVDGDVGVGDEEDGGVVYDWEDRAFVEVEGLREGYGVASAGGAGGDARSGLFGYEGFLRGMRVME